MTQLFLQAPRGKELESDLLEGSNRGLMPFFCKNDWLIFEKLSSFFRIFSL
jgi:hypothetical protein